MRGYLYLRCTFTSTVPPLVPKDFAGPLLQALLIDHTVIYLQGMAPMTRHIIQPQRVHVNLATREAVVKAGCVDFHRLDAGPRCVRISLSHLPRQPNNERLSGLVLPRMLCEVFFGEVGLPASRWSYLVRTDRHYIH